MSLRVSIRPNIQRVMLKVVRKDIFQIGSLIVRVELEPPTMKQAWCAAVRIDDISGMLREEALVELFDEVRVDED